MRRLLLVKEREGTFAVIELHQGLLVRPDLVDDIGQDLTFCNIEHPLNNIVRKLITHHDQQGRDPKFPAEIKKKETDNINESCLPFHLDIN